jgi:signal transduction histidine kinase
VTPLLAALVTDDASALVRAVAECERQLEAGALDEGAAIAAGHALLEHVRHARSDVRKAIAHAARFLPDGPFEDVVRVLREDANQFVKRAAVRAVEERGKRRKAAAARDERSADVRALEARIERAGGPEAARLSDRLRDRALSQFVEGLHHELVKVGTSLRLDVDALRRDARRRTGEELGAPADHVLAKLDALLGIVQSTRAQLGLAEPQFREESLRAVALTQVDLLRARLDEARRARLRVVVAVDQAVVVEIDRALFGQALANLLQNAVEAYPASGDGAIDVRIEAEERLSGTCALVVEDRGCGIPKACMENIGAPFASTKGAGRGLGMLNVRRVMEGMHGGRVELRSAPGEGTRIEVVVPRRQ